MEKFTVGQRVQVVNAQWLTYAVVTGFDGNYVLARLDEGGPEYMYSPEQLDGASSHTSVALDGDVIEQSSTPSEIAPVQEASSASKKAYLCLECGATYNQVVLCPTCGSEERIYNVKEATR